VPRRLREGPALTTSCSPPSGCFSPDALERMLAGLSTRRYGHGLEPSRGVGGRSKRLDEPIGGNHAGSSRRPNTPCRVYGADLSGLDWLR